MLFRLEEAVPKELNLRLIFTLRPDFSEVCHAVPPACVRTKELDQGRCCAGRGAEHLAPGKASTRVGCLKCSGCRAPKAEPRGGTRAQRPQRVPRSRAWHRNASRPCRSDLNQGYRPVDEKGWRAKVTTACCDGLVKLLWWKPARQPIGSSSAASTGSACSSWPAIARSARLTSSGFTCAFRLRASSQTRWGSTTAFTKAASAGCGSVSVRRVHRPENALLATSPRFGRFRESPKPVSTPPGSAV